VRLLTRGDLDKVANLHRERPCVMIASVVTMRAVAAASAVAFDLPARLLRLQRPNRRRRPRRGGL